MPQFDKITFFNQVFWLFTFFAGFYLIFLKIFLPKLGSVLKIRNKKLQKGAANLIAFNEEEEVEISTFDEYFIEDTLLHEKNSILNSSKKYISTNLKEFESLQDEYLNKSNILLEKLLHSQIIISSQISAISLSTVEAR